MFSSFSQVLNEALGRAVVAMVHRTHRQHHKAMASDPQNEAVPPGPGAGEGVQEGEVAPWELEQLGEPVAAELAGRGFAVVEGFLGEGWPELVLDDVLRFIKTPAKGSSSSPRGDSMQVYPSNTPLAPSCNLALMSFLSFQSAKVRFRGLERT